MQTTIPSSRQTRSTKETNVVGLVFALLVLAATLGVMWLGFIFLRDNTLPKWLNVLVAIVWGVGGAAAYFFVTNMLAEQLSDRWKQLIQPYLFIGPAMALLIWFLALPTLRTFYISLFDRNSENFVGFQNYIDVLSDRAMLVTLRNNLLWIVFGASSAVIMGLIVAVLADRSNFENLAKALIFLPMAISLVGAGVIWNFIYEVRAAGDSQIGLLNAIWTSLGFEPQAWTAFNRPWNNLFLIVIMVWLQTGFAMVLFSAAIKGIASELLEAARVDGATEWEVFFRIMLPMIASTIITVTTTIVIFTLKIFDVVIVMTGGQYDTDVIATQFYNQYFINRNFGYGSTIAIILLIAVVPVMIYNLRQFNQRKAF